MEQDFKYPMFYFLHPVISMVFILLLVAICCYCVHMSSNKYLLGWLLIVFFLVVLVVKGGIAFFKRINGQTGISVSKEYVSALYRNGNTITIPWKSIENINTYECGFGRKIYEINPGGQLKQIKFTNEIERFDMLKEMIKSNVPSTIEIK
jgi:hypothetical protein